MELPPSIREFSEGLAGRLVLLDEPGVEVKRLRERHGFTQEELAPLVGLTRESLSRIESGHVTPTRAFMQRFTRLMTLAKGARDHLAYMEARGGFPDEHHLTLLAAHLRVEREAAEEVLLAAMRSYEAKRRQALDGLRRPVRGNALEPPAASGARADAKPRVPPVATRDRPRAPSVRKDRAIEGEIP